MNLESLNRFVVLASIEPINFSRAAETLKIPQPHLSNQIKYIEKELGVELFNRKKRPPTLTPAGQEFLLETRHLLTQFERAKVTAQRVHQGELGSITIGVNTSASNSIFPQILQQFRSQFPSVSVTLHEMASYQQIVRLKDRQLDVGFFHLDNLPFSQDMDRFEIMPILEEHLIVVLPEKHPLAQQPKIKIVDLKNEDFILPNPLIGGLRHQVIHLCQQSGFYPAIKQEAAWITTFLSLVACDLGVAILPKNAQNLQRNGIVYRPIQGDSPVLRLVAVWKQDEITAPLRNFLNVLQMFVPH